MYGTKQAPREWYRAANDLIVSRGYMRATADACLYLRHSGNSFAVIILYVEDGLIASNSRSFLDSELASLHKAFKFKRLGPVSYFLGFEIHRTKDHTLVHQSKYVCTMLEKFDFASPSKRREVTAMDDRPSRYSFYSSIDGYSDASFADDPESRRSVGAYASILAGGIISWQSKQQFMIATSTTEAEILPASSATREAIWLRRLAEDNAACIQIAKDPVDHMRTKHFDTAHLFVRERVASGEVELEYCPQLATSMPRIL
ncbi:BQ5605_C018g08632 [Microbotryum silenes-dioicae]|uniref:BQ5605_C018g08632 protein n=1 Tax=Microbotryum silenes-dioicae TaxID=796604 RepID=A0A2X0MID5_9BASI|nr:BQ5605_C018g08632 [Microbotryum silenes-dioicae]